MDIIEPAAWSLLDSIAVFAGCALAIALLGTRITGVVDQLADRTGIGEAVAGAVLLGASTSLSGSVLSVTAAWKGNPELAVSNALGGIAVQTLFLVVADLVYRRANLEHAAASAPNMLQNALLIALLGLIMLAPLLPDVTLWGVHPVTPILLMSYVYGIHLVRGARSYPMWRPSRTAETREDTPEDLSTVPALPRLCVEFVLLMLGLGMAGWLLEPAANNIAIKTGLSQTAVGVLLTAVSTSIPELVTSIAAVRRGALTLAVGGIIGGNAFDTLFTAASDIAYRPGSIYHAMADDARLWVALTLIMSAILMIGLLRREEKGPAGIGFESVAIVVLYFTGVTLLLSEG
ncbi:sodium:calcium antiporter [Marinobacter sp.]|uniref:sodium:calcium antiporter n=1 Tax=Marinobacter sp. TaxID=50741 RepID=UPI00384D5603